MCVIHASRNVGKLQHLHISTNASQRRNVYKRTRLSHLSLQCHQASLYTSQRASNHYFIFIMYGKVLILVAIVAQLASAQVGIPCHADFFQMTPRHNIDLQKFMGTWYFHEYASSDIGNTPEPNFRCMQTFMFHPNQSDITEINSIDSWVNSTTGQWGMEGSTMHINNTRSPFTSMWNAESESGERAQMIVFQSDLEHNKWAVVYRCAHVGPEMYRWETLTALTRSRQLSDEDRNDLKALIVGYGFRIGDHKTIDQSNC